jgi:hypothetical protein
VLLVCAPTVGASASQRQNTRERERERERKKERKGLASKLMAYETVERKRRKTKKK